MSASLHPDAGLPGRSPPDYQPGEGIYLLTSRATVTWMGSLPVGQPPRAPAPGTGPGPGGAAAQVAHSTLGDRPSPAILLARRLAEMAPAGLNKVFFSDNGSTAVEAALKVAFQFWRNRGRRPKQRFLKLSDAYHGDTLGAVSSAASPCSTKLTSRCCSTPWRPRPPTAIGATPGRLPGACPSGWKSWWRRTTRNWRRGSSNR